MDGFECINIHEAKKKIDAGGHLIVDVRDPASYGEAHVANAIYLTDQNIQSFIRDMDKNAPVICYCYHGNSSQMAAMFLLENGFKQVYSIDGGFEAWREVYPAVEGAA